MSASSYHNVNLLRFVLWLHIVVMGLGFTGLWLADHYGASLPLFSQSFIWLVIAGMLVPAVLLLLVAKRLVGTKSRILVPAGFVALNLVSAGWLLSVGFLPGGVVVLALVWLIIVSVLLFSPSGILLTLLAVVALVTVDEIVISAGAPDWDTLLGRVLMIISATFFTTLIIGYLQQQAERSAAGREDTQAVLESMKDGLLVVDASNRLQYVNPKVVEYLGEDTRALIGNQLEEKSLKTSGHENLASVLFYGERAKPEDDAGEVNEVVIEKPITRILRVTSVAVRGAGQRLQGFSHLLQDVTDERTLTQTKTAFIAILSHSLRTPLNGIKWALEMLTKEKLSPAEQEPVFQEIAKQENLLENMVEGLVLASELQKGEMSYKMETIDLVEVVRSAAALHEGEAQQKKLTLTVAVPKHAVKLKADRVKLKIALSNIIANAVKYTDKGAIAVNLTESKQGAAVSVQDTGIGIPKDQQARLFSQFFWAKNAVMHQHEGAGMGLYVTKQIIDKHNGKISLSSDLGQGTTVTVGFKV